MHLTSIRVGTKLRDRRHIWHHTRQPVASEPLHGRDVSNPLREARRINDQTDGAGQLPHTSEGVE